MKIIHLSHTDLDGYGCQYVSRFFLSKRYEMSFYNSNYGKEIEEKFDMILAEIDSSNEKAISFLCLQNVF